MSRHVGDYHFIIVGAGSAGCVLANRLSACSRFRVLLLEAGKSDRTLYNGFWSHLPLGYSQLFNRSSANWQYYTEPESKLGHRTMYWPRGKLLGGSSAINAMVWSRGFPSDYDAWAQTAPGWAWSDVEPVFRQLETWHGPFSHNRGFDGPQAVSDITQTAHPICHRFIAAGQACGYGVTRDYNGEQFEGVCHYQLTTARGLRVSAARSYLHPIKSRSNLDVITSAEVDSLIGHDRIMNTVCWTQGQQRYHAISNKQIILSAGAISSPAILERSGIGDPDLLQQLGIPVVHSSPHVGCHLQDHLGADAVFHCTESTLNQELSSWPARVRAGLQFLIKRSGPLTMSGNHAGGFIRSSQDIDQPDMQLYFCPLSYNRAPSNTRPMITLDPFPGFIIGFNPCRPSSRGSIHIRSKNPSLAPVIQANYLSTQNDTDMMLKGMQVIRRLSQQAPLANVISKEITPGPDCRSNEDLLEHIRATSWTVFHPVGTCRMDRDPNRSVVSERLSVHGVTGLSVVDASVFPTLPSGNTNAPCLMVAEKAADMILSDHV